MDKININPDFTLEEQLIIIVDKYISKRYHPRDKSFSYQLYLIFVGYHGNDSNLLIVFYVQIMPDDFVMQLHRF
ncbi:hypothetical protein AM375_11005 [Escherichia coli]|nr:hypothetical protein AM375_11005 [Escherichia coli]